MRLNHIILKRIKENRMGRMIIDGNSFFEIDEECLKKKRLPKECGLEKYLNEMEWKDKNDTKNVSNKKKRGDG